MRVRWLLPAFVVPIAIGCGGGAGETVSSTAQPPSGCDAASTVRTYWDVDPKQARAGLEGLRIAWPDLEADVQLQIDQIDAVYATGRQYGLADLMKAGDAQRRIDARVVGECGASIWGM